MNPKYALLVALSLFCINISAQCDITGGVSGVTNISCDVTGLSFDIEINGTNTGSSWVANDIYNSSGAYDTPVSMGPYPVNLMNTLISFTISDVDDPTCTTDVFVFSPVFCVCNLQETGLTNISCDDNATPNDPTDDFITFSVNPDGVIVGPSYSIAGMEPSGGMYGEVTSFSTAPGTAGTGDMLITIVDDNDPTCMIEFTLTDTGVCSATLPIEIVSFEGQRSGRENIITWALHSYDTEKIELQKSKNGVDFNTIYTSPTANGYIEDRFRDKNNAQESYYRLVHYDYNGRREVSEFIYITGSPTQVNGIQVYPNPFNDVVTIEFPYNAAAHSVIVTDINGVQLRKYTNESIEDHVLTIDNLDGYGVYFVHIIGEQNNDVIKILGLK